jgi:hypothetical protein
LLKFLPEVNINDLMAAAMINIVRASRNSYALYTRLCVERIENEDVALKSSLGDDSEQEELEELKMVKALVEE